MQNKEKLLKFKGVNLKRCTKCILPETMPFIRRDETEWVELVDCEQIC